MASRKEALLTRPLMMFMATMVLANIAGHMYEPMLPLYLQSLGAGIGQVGLFFTLGAIAPLAFQILGGWLSDSIGRLQAVALGSLAGLLGWVVTLIAPSWQWLLLSTVLASMAVSFIAPSYQAFIAEQSTEANRGRVYGMTEGIFRLVGVIGPPIGGFLSQRFGFRPMIVAAAALYFGATAIRLLMARGARTAARAEPARPRPALAGLKTSLATMTALLVGGGTVTWILLSDGLRDGLWNLSGQLQPLFMQNIAGLTNLQIGWLVSIMSITSVIITGPAGWLSDRRGERAGIVGGFLVIAVGVFIFVNSRVFASFVAAWIMFGLGEALMAPAYASLISKVVPQHLRGMAFGVFSTSVGFLSLPLPFIGAQLWERVGPQAPFYCAGVVTLLVAPVLWGKFKLPKGGAGAEPVLTPTPAEVLE